MACGCSGTGAVGMNSDTGVMTIGARVTNRLVYRLLAPGTVDPDNCVARDDASQCLDFASLQIATQYKSDFGVNGTAIGVIIATAGVA